LGIPAAPWLSILTNIKADIEELGTSLDHLIRPTVFVRGPFPPPGIMQQGEYPQRAVGGDQIQVRHPPYYVGSGNIFGEIAALDGKERAADAVALEDCQIFTLNALDLLPTLAAHPHAMLQILHALCEKIRIAATIIEDNPVEMRWRTARKLLRLARQHGRTVADGGPLQLTISQGSENIWEPHGRTSTAS
jgi:CRP-like cAMP-binding protein